MGAKRERTRMLEVGSGRQALVAAPTISTISDPSTTGVSSQENVLVLFDAIRLPDCLPQFKSPRRALIATKSRTTPLGCWAMRSLFFFAIEQSLEAHKPLLRMHPQRQNSVYRGA